MDANKVTWECHLRTKAKLEILRAYLGAWFGILAVKNFSHVFYIDGFSGPGEYSGGEEGSPVIAAKMASSVAQKNRSFKATLIFVDKAKKAIDHLKTRKEIKNPHPNVRIELLNGVFAEKLDDIISQLSNQPRSPTFSFIDPFGFGHSPFYKIQRLIHNDNSELFVNCMCGFMNRFKEHQDEEVIDKIKNMIGEEDLQPVIQSEDSIDAICTAFEKNLQTIGKFTLKFMMRDENNIRDNAFFFCGNQAKGFEKIKEAMWKIDPVHGNAFSAYQETNSSVFQGGLFPDGPDTHKLGAMIQQKFTGATNVPVSDIFAWVIEHTDTFLPKHARVEMENLLARGVITQVYDPSGKGQKRRKNTWPPRLMVSFAG